ncbi:MAG: 4-hydroxybenzoate octaprenyltransferase [Gammaproteobacteria bacterium]|nr:4-hydroxybenzoate octaprenyltransferase [Gammaproteobacteria bacterium]
MSWASDRLQQYAVLMRIDRPIGTFLLLWPTLWAVWIAGQGRPDPYILLVFIAGVFIMRSAGCVINDFADRGFDPHVERTRQRPIAAGRVAPVEAVALFVGLCLVGFGLVATLQPIVLRLAVVGVALAAVYPFLKRITHLPQLWLGVAFSWGIPMAFAAHAGHVPAIAWWLVAANASWAVAYDTIYAMVDRDDDVKVGVKSTAILLGRYDRAGVAVFQILTLALLAVTGLYLDRNRYYFWGLVVAGLLMLYQQALIRERQPRSCFVAFLNNNWVGAIVFVALVLSYL